MRLAFWWMAFVLLAGCTAPLSGPPSATEDGPGATEESPPGSVPAPVLTAQHLVGETVWSAPHRWSDGFLVTLGGDTITAKRFDADWNLLGTHTLVAGPPKPVDHQSVVLDGRLYVAYSAGVNGQFDNALYLSAFGPDLAPVGSLVVTEDSPRNMPPGPGNPDEPTNDMFLSAIDGRLYLGIFHVEPGASGMRVRVYDAGLEAVDDRILAGAAMQNGGAFLRGPDGDGFWYVTGASGPDPAGNRDLHALRFDGDLGFVSSTRITDDEADEWWPMGAVRDGDAIYVAHAQAPQRNTQFCPTCDTGTIMLRVYDADWSERHVVQVTPDGVTGQRAHLLRSGGATYVGYDVQDGGAAAWVAELRDEAVPAG